MPVVVAAVRPRSRGSVRGTGRDRVHDRRHAERNADAARCLAADQAVHGRRRGVQPLSQGPVLLESPIRGVPSQGTGSFQAGAGPGAAVRARARRGRGLFQHPRVLQLSGAPRRVSKGGGRGGKGSGDRRRAGGGTCIARPRPHVLRLELRRGRARVSTGDSARPPLWDSAVLVRCARDGARPDRAVARPVEARMGGRPALGHLQRRQCIHVVSGPALRRGDRGRAPDARTRPGVRPGARVSGMGLYREWEIRRGDRELAARDQAAGRPPDGDRGAGAYLCGCGQERRCVAAARRLGLGRVGALRLVISRGRRPRRARSTFRRHRVAGAGA